MKIIQYNLFSDDITERKGSLAMTQNDMFNQIAEDTLDSLIRNGVEPENYNQFIPRVLSSSFKKNSPSYNRVIKKIKCKLKGGDYYDEN